MFQVKKKVIQLFSVCIVAATLLAATPIAAATEIQPTAAAISCDKQAAPRTEETVWVIREYNGKKQMRLWSITRGKWLTDWLDYAF